MVSRNNIFENDGFNNDNSVHNKDGTDGDINNATRMKMMTMIRPMMLVMMMSTTVMIMIMMAIKCR